MGVSESGVEGPQLHAERMVRERVLRADGIPQKGVGRGGRVSTDELR